MAEVTNESFQELISTTKETNKILREDMALESKPDPGKFIKEEASNLLIADANRRSSKELLKTEQQERTSDQKSDLTNKEQRVKLIEEQEKTTKAILMMATKQDMQSKVDTMLASANAEDEEKRTSSFKKIFASIKDGFAGFKKTSQATQAFLKKVPGAGILMTTLKALGFLGLIALLNDPRIKKLGATLVRKVLPALAYVIDNVIRPFIDFVFEMFMGTHPALVTLKNAIKKYGPDFLKGEADGIAKTMGLLAGALAVGVLFAPFKTLGLMTATGVFGFKILTGALKGLAKYFSGMGKGVDKVAKAAKVTSTAAGAAGAAGAVAGASKVVTGKPGTFDPKTKRMFGADSKLTTTVKGDKGAAELSKKIQAQAGGADKLSHLKKFPRLMRVATRLPFFGTLLSTGLLVDTLLDDRVSKEDKIKAVGGVIGGAIGGFGGAKLGALAGAMTGPIGALVGAFGGAAAGFFAGDEIGQMIAEFMMDGKQPERPKVTARGGRARRNQIKRQQAFDAAMVGEDTPSDVAGGRGRGPTAAELSEMRNLPRSNGGAGQGMQPVNAMQDRSPPVSPVLNAPTSVVDNSQTSYSTNTKSLVIPDNVIATLNAVR